MDWVLVGSITGFVIFVISIIKFIDYKVDRKKKELEELQTDDISYSIVLDEYNNATPYKRKKFQSSYKDVKVRWHVEYYAIADTYKFGRVGMVMSFSDRLKFQYVNFKADFKKFPIIKSAKGGDKFYITGLVDSVEGSTVYLKLIDIEKDKFFVF